ncbi:MAG TPA: PhzF family phenazine biosynthesis protein [Candidatus Sulfotelmatobacter sp.]|nr:PhzF family phenazine biosynthesis protein [Candidatus Sulfotelmatobacter sp.]
MAHPWLATNFVPRQEIANYYATIKIDQVRIPLFHVDAFTEKPFRGNPAAVCFLDSWLDEDRLRKVAAENNLSETAFLVPSQAGHELRWFSPTCEVRLCGHATLASAHVLLNLRQPQLDSVRFKTKFHGTLTVRKAGEFLAMDFPALFPQPCTNSPDIWRDALAIQSLPSEVVEADETYILVVDRPETVRNVRPNSALLRNLHPYVVALTARGDEVDFVSRYFAPSYGIPEDPVTGSVHCILAPYWAKRLGKPKLHARQLSERGGEVWCELMGDRVLLKGMAVVTLEGSLSI